MLYSHNHDQLYKHICMRNHSNDTIIDERRHFFRKIYLSFYMKGLCVRGSWRPNKNCNILTPTLMAISVVSFSFSRVAQREARGHSSLQGAGFLYRISSPNTPISKHPDLQTDFLTSPSYILVQSPTQYLPITGHRNVSLPPSLEWHV